MGRTGDSRGQKLSLFPASKKKGGIEIKDRKTGHEIRAPCGMEMWITGYGAMENAIHSTWKSQSAAFPRPANSVSHSPKRAASYPHSHNACYGGIPFFPSCLYTKTDKFLADKTVFM